MGSFFYHCVAVASNCAFRARSVHSYATFSQFKRSCAPHCVSQSASDCDADRSSRQISIYSVFELLNIIFLNRKSSHVNLFVKLYISMKIQGNTCYESFFSKSRASRFLSKFGAIAAKCAFRARSVHSYTTFSQFKRSCAPHCVRNAAQLCHKPTAIDYMGTH